MSTDLEYSEKDRGYKVYEAVFDEKKVGTLDSFEEFTIHHLFANVWSRSTDYGSNLSKDEMISLRERSMITVTILASLGRLDELKKHIAAALHLGISRKQIDEMMIHIAHYAGWPAGHSGKKILNEVLKELPENKLED